MTKTHFLVLRFENGRKYLLTLPGQTAGRGRPVSGGIIVKPRKGAEAQFRILRKNSPDGTVFFTQSLSESSHCYCAADLQPVSSLYEDADEDLFSCSDRVRTEWEEYRNGHAILLDCRTLPGLP